jgi:putative pyruvate formate lyase activating enzyme
MRFLAAEISKGTYVNIMDQYYPCGDIPPGSALERRITRREYDQALLEAEEEGITRLDIRKRRFF